MFLKSQKLRSPHAFSTRLGGVSTLAHTKEMNLAFFRGDENEVVLKNLERFAAEVGFDPQNVISLPQIHSNTVYKVGREDAGQGYYLRENIREGDGYVTGEKDIVLGVKAADCVPILFEAEQDGKIVAVGAVHAGWRGTVSLIQQTCVRMLCEEYAVTPASIRAAIGPCIHSCCYEVDLPFLSQVTDTLGEDLAHRFITPTPAKEGKYACDLVGLNLALLEEIGVSGDRVDVIDQCTCCHPDLFYSHRYSTGKRGTMLNVIMLN